ncbi:Uncharacterised protein [Mycobacterium tuberculosis]|nr:Uncharacterised protein [Mycobacterium tuberculosis]
MRCPPPRRRMTGTGNERARNVNSGPRPASAADRRLPRWAGKPVRRLTAAELAEALTYLERHRPDDDVLGRALAGEFARRTAAAEFARETATRPPGPSARVSPRATPGAPDGGGPRRPGA